MPVRSCQRWAPILGLAGVLAACGPSAHEARPGTRGPSIPTAQVETIVVTSAHRSAPASPFPHPTRRKKGPGRGPGCRCNRRHCAMVRPSEAPVWCGVHEAAVGMCFRDANLAGRAVVTVTTDAAGRVQRAEVRADERVLDCLYDQATRAAFPERPGQSFQVVYDVEP